MKVPVGQLGLGGDLRFLSDNELAPRMKIRPINRMTAVTWGALSIAVRRPRRPGLGARGRGTEKR